MSECGRELEKDVWISEPGYSPDDKPYIWIRKDEYYKLECACGKHFNIQTTGYAKRYVKTNL